MRRRSRRAARRARAYTIAQLLARQPKGLRRIDHYQAMLRQFNASPRVQQLRVGRRCYALLDAATIEPENLYRFYRTYGLPADPFFPLFLSVKRAYLSDRERVAEERRAYILSKLRGLPPHTLDWFRHVGYLERYYSPTGASPVWQRQLFPGSKKRADELAGLGTLAWRSVFARHLGALAERYPGLTRQAASRLLACFVLELPPGSIPPTRRDPAEVNRSYRRLTLLHHPDRGGSAPLFIELKRARDTLLGAP